MTDRIKRKDQLKLPGTFNAQDTRLEDIEDTMEENDGKIAKLRKANRELSDEAVALTKVMKVKGTRVRGSNEWYVDKPSEKYKRRRFKDSKEPAGGKTMEEQVASEEKAEEAKKESA